MFFFLCVSLSEMAIAMSDAWHLIPAGLLLKSYVQNARSRSEISDRERIDQLHLNNLAN